MKRLVSAAAVFLFCAAPPALAAFHLMVIQEVFPGPPSDASNPSLTPDQRGQYVMLRMTSGFQNLVDGTSFRVEDADGNLLGSFGAFTADAANGGMGCAGYPTCPAVLAGTAAADSLFTFAFDKDVDGQGGRVALPLAGGRVCFVLGTSVVDCVAWGNFDCTRSGNCALPNGLRAGTVAANTCDTNYGTPASPGGLVYGQVLRRTAFSCVASENSTQFGLAFPRPVNNAGNNNNVDGDADGLIDVLDCDDTTGTRLWPIGEARNVKAAIDDQTFTWDSQAATSGSAVTYDVVRGTVAALSGFADAACFDPGISNASTVDAGTPSSGGGSYYLVRAHSTVTCGGPGTYGPNRAAIDAVCP